MPVFWVKILGILSLTNTRHDHTVANRTQITYLTGDPPCQKHYEPLI